MVIPSFPLLLLLSITVSWTHLGEGFMGSTHLPSCWTCTPPNLHHPWKETSWSSTKSNYGPSRRIKTELFLFRRIFNRFKRQKDTENTETLVTTTTGPEQDNQQMKVTKVLASSPITPHRNMKELMPEEADVCIIGAGVSGLTAALQTCCTMLSNNTRESDAASIKVIVLEASPTTGGRVQSDVTENGFILDRGFAVFLESYPVAQNVLDYEALQLRPFLPGALIKLPNRFRLARVSDPLREPGDLITALLAPVGEFLDKLKVVPLIWHVRTSSIEELFHEPETDTAECLENRWGFSTSFRRSFFEPFLEGIYLAPIERQSSRMFHFVMKMFSEGSAHLPAKGIGAVAQQLEDRVRAAGADIRTQQTVTNLLENDNGTYSVETYDKSIRTKSIIIATDGQVAQQLIAQFEGYATLEDLPALPQRSVGCLYYSFQGPPPVEDPILILNGNAKERNTKEHPINNICFPSSVHASYVPDGFSLCSVTVLMAAMEAYENDRDGLDRAVRQQLAGWFRETYPMLTKDAILKEWKLERIYYINNAQPAQLEGPYPANENGGRCCSVYRGKRLPPNVFVCGDHMATATLNGALESGVQAGQMALKAVKTIMATAKENQEASTAV